jgi:glycosyltransferase involved in cell wall biosynthesis
MRQPSILIFCPVLGAFGGTETHIVGIASALGRSGWNVRVAVLRNRLNASSAAEIRQSGAAFAGWPSPAFLASVLAPCDILYTNSQGNASPWIWRLKGAAHRGFHHIHTSAGLDEQHYWPSGFRAFVQTARCLVACSQATRANLLDAGASGGVTFLPYLTSVVSQGRGEGTPRPKSGAVRFAFIGRVEKAKGIDLIIAAAKSSECHGIEWHVHGEGDYLAVLRAADLPNVVLHGGFSGAGALTRIHEDADALVLPSFHSEGMPLALLEGMAKGLPWIATNKGGTAELAGGHKDLIVFEPGDVAGFIQSSARLRDRLVAEEVDAAGIQHIFEAGYSREVATARWLEFVSGLLPRGE